jgi:hypothetical protein
MRIRNRTAAALVYAFVGIVFAGGWYVTCCFANPQGTTGTEYLKYTLFESNQHRAAFWWFAVLTLICIGLAASYLTRAASSRVGARSLFSIGLVTAIAAWATIAWSHCFFISLAAFFGYRNMMQVGKSENPKD